MGPPAGAAVMERRRDPLNVPRFIDHFVDALKQPDAALAVINSDAENCDRDPQIYPDYKID
jgi:hypothetical protein